MTNSTTNLFTISIVPTNNLKTIYCQKLILRYVICHQFLYNSMVNPKIKIRWLLFKNHYQNKNKKISGMSSRGGVTSSRTVTSSSTSSTRSGGFEMPIHISIGGSSADFSKPKTPRPRTMPFSFEDPFASSSLKMTSAEEMMSQMQAQMQVQMQQMQKSLQVKH